MSYYKNLLNPNDVFDICLENINKIKSEKIKINLSIIYYFAKFVLIKFLHLIIKKNLSKNKKDKNLSINNFFYYKKKFNLDIKFKEVCKNIYII